MKSKFLFTFLTCFLLSFTIASGQSLSLESVDGLSPTGEIVPGVSTTFNLRLTNNEFRNSGITNGFSISSPDGANWGSLVGDTLVGFRTAFDLIFQINTFSNGEVEDTVGFGGAALFGAGLVANFDEVAYSITIGPVSIEDAGKTIVLDSSFYMPTGAWKWAGPIETALWDGPHTFVVEGGDPPNAPPILAAIGAQSIDEGQPLTVNVSATDDDGDAMILTTSALPAGALFSDNGNGTGSLTWTPGFDQAGDYDVTFTVDDGTDTNFEIVTITVVNANQAPVLDAIGPQATDEDVVLNFAVSASDPDGTTPLLSATGLPTGATFVAGTFSWIPDFTQAGSYDVTFTASDGDLSDEEIVTITVNNVNRAPSFAVYVDDQIIDEGQALGFIHPSADPDLDDVLTKTWTTLPEGATYVALDATVNQFDWTPSFDQAGDYQVIFTISDGEFSDVDTVNITVIDVNQPPVLAPIGPQAVTAGEILFIHIMSSDFDGNPLTLGAAPLPGTAELVDSGNGNGFFRWATEIADSGTYNVEFTSFDGEFTAGELVTITVGEAPKFIVVDSNNFSFTFIAGETIVDTAFVNITELNGSPITVEAFESSSWMDLSGFSPSVVPAQLKIAVHPNGLPIGTYHDTVTINSAEVFNSQIIFITMNIVERPNTPAYLTSQLDSVYFIDECTQLDVRIVTTDDESDAITISMTGIVENMTYIDNGDGTADFNFTPNFSQEGFYNVEVVLFDGRDSSQFPFGILVDSCSPGTEGDTVTVATVPAVPGARVTVAVDYATLCQLWRADVSIGWTSEHITLDSASINGAEFNLWSGGITIHNDSNFMELNALWVEVAQSPTSGNMMNLHFSLDVGTPAGFYPLDFHFEPMYQRDCGGGEEQVRPYFISGGIVVDTSGNYVCGYVVDPEGNAVAGATVELWDNFPSGSAQDMQDASGTGVFAFDNFNTIPFDLYAYQDGYYPGRVENINFAQSGIMIVLTPMTDIVTPTNTWVDFFCGVNTFKNSPLPVGSVVEAYDPDGIKCGEFVVHTSGEYGFMHVYGDDEFTTEDEGATAGDVIRFYVNGIEAIAGGSTVWTEDRAIIEVCLDVPDVTPHSCFLTAGWNLVSWNVDTDVDDIAGVLASIDECVEVVMGFEQGALTYDATLPQFSDLWTVDHLSAYWIKVSCDVELTVLGTPVPSTTPIPVTAGWNLVSYLPESSMPTEVALTTIHNDLVVALGYDNGAGLTYLPGQTEFNDLTTMSSCFGYWVKVLNNGTLIYPDGGADSVMGKNIFSSKSSSAGRIAGTTSWMNIYAYDLKVNDTRVKAGAEINAFNSNDELVGSYVMKKEGQFGFMPIYGDDSQTDYVDGMKSGETFYLTIDGIETAEQFTWTTSGDKIEVKQLTAKVLDGALPNSFGLNQNYPNPFNPSTTISFDMPVTGQAKIEVFNLLGQLIATPFDEVAAAGQHVIMWDGQNDNGKTVASGIYFYRLTADNFTDTKKMTLLK